MKSPGEYCNASLFLPAPNRVAAALGIADNDKAARHVRTDIALGEFALGIDRGVNIAVVLLPDAVYPGGTDYFRVAVHAIAVVIETAMLVFIGLAISSSFAAVDEARRIAEQSADELEKFAISRP